MHLNITVEWLNFQTFKNNNLPFINITFPKFAFLRCRVPSFISSVAKQFPNSFTSKSKPFVVSSYTALAVLIHAATANGALLIYMFQELLLLSSIILSCLTT